MQRFILFLLFKILEARAVSTILLDKMKSNRASGRGQEISLSKPQLSTQTVKSFVCFK